MKYFLTAFILFFSFSHLKAHTIPTIEGFECQRAERTVALHQGTWSDYHCTEGEWLMRLDEGRPFIVRLSEIFNQKSDHSQYFTIIPTIPVDAKTRWVLRRHWMRVTLSGEVEFIPKR